MTNAGRGFLSLESSMTLVTTPVGAALFLKSIFAVFSLLFSVCQANKKNFIRLLRA